MAILRYSLEVIELWWLHIAIWNESEEKISVTQYTGILQPGLSQVLGSGVFFAILFGGGVWGEFPQTLMHDYMYTLKFHVHSEHRLHLALVSSIGHTIKASQ